jgi:endonuclease/exonuclease/phosphatase family metal-dependent hydrolase
VRLPVPRVTARARFAAILALAACGQHADPVTADAGEASADSGGSADAATLPPDAPAVADAGGAVRFRIMAANTTSGTQQSYEQPGIDLFEGLKPDLALVQEFNYTGGARALVDAAFGKDFSVFVDPRTGGIPNGIVSRFPILESGVWVDASVDDRAFVYARIDVPGPVDLWAVSVHLLTTGATERGTEAAQLLGYLTANVPPGDYLVVGGDFNTDTTSEAALGTLSAAVGTVGPWPADQSGNSNTSINRNHPHDYVLVGPSLDAHKVPVAIGSATFAAGLVFDSRVYTPLADVTPILATDSGASGMQHMPVVRDFALAGD